MFWSSGFLRLVAGRLNSKLLVDEARAAQCRLWHDRTVRFGHGHGHGHGLTRTVPRTEARTRRRVESPADRDRPASLHPPAGRRRVTGTPQEPPTRTVPCLGPGATDPPAARGPGPNPLGGRPAGGPSPARADSGSLRLPVGAAGTDPDRVTVTTHRDGGNGTSTESWSRY